MEKKFSQGKWTVTSGIIRCNDEPIAFTAGLTSRVDETRLPNESWLSMRKRTEPLRNECDEEKEANAKLIAAAPDLLDALDRLIKHIVSVGPFGKDDINEILVAKQAIKKATS